MADKRTADILTALEQVVLGVDQRVQATHTLLESVHDKIDELRREQANEAQRPLKPIPMSNIVEPYRDSDVSASFNIGGLEGSISREFWHNHGAKIKLALFTALTWTFGWASKVFHIALSK